VAVKRAKEQLESRGGGYVLRRRTQNLLRDLDMILKLEETCLEVKVLRSGVNPGAAVAEDYQQAFRAYGIDVEALDPPQAGQLIRQQDIGQELITGLEYWAIWLIVHDDPMKKETWKRLVRVARQAEADDGRNQVYLAIERDDADALKMLARADKVAMLLPSTQLLFALALDQLGAKREAEDLLRKAQRRYPGDFWINTTLGGICFQRSEKNEDVRFLRNYLSTP
jgi:hypothetical protein